jgi:adhesin/invasin
VDIGAFDAGTVNAFRVVAPAEVAAGQPFAVTVVAVDAAGNLASTYTGTIHFSSTDLDAELPADYRFAPGDAGVATFIVTLETPGSQLVQVNDINTTRFEGIATVNVDAPSDTPGRAARLADLVCGAADPLGLDLPFVVPGRKNHHGIWPD